MRSEKTDKMRNCICQVAISVVIILTLTLILSRLSQVAGDVITPSKLLDIIPYEVDYRCVCLVLVVRVVFAICMADRLLGFR